MMFRLAVACSIALWGCGDDGPIGARDAVDPMVDAVPPASVESRVIVLEAGASAEARLTVPFRDSVRLRYVASGGAIEWDVHRHTDGQSVPLVSGSGEAGDETFRQLGSGDVHASWSNPTSASISVAVTIELYGGAALIEWYF